MGSTLQSICSEMGSVGQWARFEVWVISYLTTLLIALYSPLDIPRTLVKCLWMCGSSREGSEGAAPTPVAPALRRVPTVSTTIVAISIASAEITTTGPQQTPAPPFGLRPPLLLRMGVQRCD